MSDAPNAQSFLGGVLPALLRAVCLAITAVPTASRTRRSSRWSASSRGPSSARGVLDATPTSSVLAPCPCLAPGRGADPRRRQAVWSDRKGRFLRDRWASLLRRRDLRLPSGSGRHTAVHHASAV